MYRHVVFISTSLALAAALLSVPGEARQATPTLSFRPITVAADGGRMVAAETATLVVPESRRRRDGASVKLPVVRLRSRAAKPGPAIVYLAGGPGSSGVAALRSGFGSTVDALLERSDVILFDQRGTGGAEPSLALPGQLQLPLDKGLYSPEFREALYATARGFAETMRSRGIDLAAYNTVESAADLEDLRQALGIERWITWGHSYGSHLALAYLRRHEAAIARVIVSGINGPDQRRRFPLDGDALLGRIDAAVRNTPRLARVMPDFIGSTQRVLRRLEQQPATVMVDRADVFVGAAEVSTLIAIQSGDRDFIMALPLMIGRLEAGDYEGTARQIRNVIKRRPAGTAMTYAMDLASGVSPARAARIVTEAPKALLGNAINWPFGDPGFAAALGVPVLPDAFRAPIRSSVPALFISGTLDGRTSIGDAEEVRAGFPNSGHLIVDGASHTPYAFAVVRDRMSAFAGGMTAANERVSVELELRGPDEPVMVEELRALAVAEGADSMVARMRAMATDPNRHFTSFVPGNTFFALRDAKRMPEAIAALETGLVLFPANVFLQARLREVKVP
jgi:pimeloyl-ACP methyl ester carboxylesterase